jgi:DNA polymerase-3 subunit delta'
MHHAYLFEGPRGVGKRVVANHLALLTNCTDDMPNRPCGGCNNCRQILAGTHPDVLVLQPRADRASQTIALDDVREVIRKTTYKRYGAKRRFVLVDPADSLMPAAANALLKTLEEPTPGTGFILICANTSAMLPTILSRCQRIRFGAVGVDRVQQWLTQQGHKEQAETAAVWSLGCPGRALNLVEGQLSKRLALRNELLSAIVGETKGRFDWVAKITKGPRTMWRGRVETILELLEELLRDVAILNAGVDQPLMHGDIRNEVARWDRQLWPDGVRRVHDRIEETRDNLAVMVGGKLALDALLAAVSAELDGA